MLGVSLLLRVLAAAGADGRVVALLGSDSGILWCRTAAIRGVLLHLYRNLLDAALGIVGSGCVCSCGVVAGSTVLPHPPGG